jgi:hypothetical protein
MKIFQESSCLAHQSCIGGSVVGWIRWKDDRGVQTGFEANSFHIHCVTLGWLHGLSEPSCPL